MSIGDVYEYRLPPIADNEKNEIEVYIDTVENLEDSYPLFISIDYTSNTIRFRPDSTLYSGQTYYFSIVLKRKNSDVNMYKYYCTVKIEGEVITITAEV